MTQNYVTCLKCRRISFAVTKEYAEDEVKRFNEYFATLDKEKQDLYYGGVGANISSYKCIRCAGNSFRPSTEAELDKVNGCTINAVIYE